MKMTINGTRSPSLSEILCALRNLINRPKLKSKDIAMGSQKINRTPEQIRMF